MLRMLTVVTFIATAIAMQCRTARADNPFSYIQVTLDSANSKSTISVSGGTSVDAIFQVTNSMASTGYPVDRINVGPWRQPPSPLKGDAPAGQQLMLRFWDQSGASTEASFMAMSPEFPHEIGFMIAGSWSIHREAPGKGSHRERDLRLVSWQDFVNALSDDSRLKLDAQEQAKVKEGKQAEPKPVP